MKKMLATSIGLLVLVGLAHGMGSKPLSSTGDRQLDATLEKINVQAKADPDGFIRHLSMRHNIPEQEVRQAQENYGLRAGDLLMATALAKATQRSVLSVTEQYQKNRGDGWGVMAKELGIKPGSRGFHELKAGAQVSLTHLKAMAKAKHKHGQEMKNEHEQRMKKDRQANAHGKPR